MRSSISLIQVVSLAISLLFVSFAWAISLEVDPSTMVIKGVPSGKVVKVSDLWGKEMRLRITNTEKSARTYTTEVLPVSKTGTVPKAGYIDIPDTSWIWIEQDQILVPGNSEKELELFLKIPGREEYRDKDFQAIIEVKTKKNRPEEVFVLAAQVRMSFSTGVVEEEIQQNSAEEQKQQNTKRRRRRNR